MQFCLWEKNKIKLDSMGLLWLCDTKQIVWSINIIKYQVLINYRIKTSET